jgi:hypothetical protein
MTIPKTKEKIEEFKKDYSSLPKDKLLENIKPHGLLFLEGGLGDSRQKGIRKLLLLKSSSLKSNISHIQNLT